MLEQAPGLRPVAVYEELIRRHPELGPGVRRTLERDWRPRRRGAGRVAGSSRSRKPRYASRRRRWRAATPRWRSYAGSWGSAV